jgi:hypothetical protein
MTAVFEHVKCFSFLPFRKLHCQRNTVHINMFISFILRSIICFIKDVNISPTVYISYGRDEDTPEVPKLRCIVLLEKVVFLNYFYGLLYFKEYQVINNDLQNATPKTKD